MMRSVPDWDSVAEQRALRAAQGLDALDVDQARVRVEAGLGDRRFVQVHTGGGIGAVLDARGRHAAKHNRGAGRFTPREGQAGNAVGVVVQHRETLALDIGGGEGGDGLGQVLQVGLALGGRDDDFFQRQVRGIGGRRGAEHGGHHERQRFLPGGNALAGRKRRRDVLILHGRCLARTSYYGQILM